MARELDREGLERALWPHFERPPHALAHDIAVALYRHGALTREEIVRTAGLGKRRLPRVEAALRLEPLLTLLRSVRSERDGSRRLVLALNRFDGRERVETVSIPRREDLAICLSSQAGCGLECTFCATGGLGFRANLTVGEIVEQHAWVERTARKRVTDVVFMGMGEPLLNYDAVITAAYRLAKKEGSQISPRRVMISTVGIVPRIREYARERHPFQLLFSLTSAIPKKRLALMPIEKKYSLRELRDAILEYQRSRRRNRRVTLEYVALPHVNMGEEDVSALAGFVEGLPCIVNVIPYNPTGASFRPPTWAEVKEFTTALRRLQVPVKVRYSSGKSVAAGCGQLVADLVALKPCGGHIDSPPGIFSDL